LNAEVWGIEIDKQAGSIAQTRIDKVLIGDLSVIIEELPDGYFDCIVFNDVLEHLVDPFNILLNIKKKLSSDGLIVSSIPNVRYFYNLRDLLIKKQWRYEDAGILDKTHLRFFTFRSMLDMYKSLGYDVKIIEGINPITLWKFNLLNCFSFGYLADTRYSQFACVAKPTI
jgi:SAM-dependent methyltransferase